MASAQILFPTFVYQDHVLETESLKHSLMDMISNRYKNYPYRVPMEWETKKLYTSYGDNNKNLENVFKTHYLKYIKGFFPDQKVILKSIWFNYYPTGDHYQEIHNHLNSGGDRSDFSGIHFLSFDPDQHSSVVFHDPSRLAKSTVKDLNYSSKILFSTQEGSLILFPSYLEHSIPQSSIEYTKPRITISFNISLTLSKH